MPDGSEYMGEFVEGVQHGDGLITTKDGTQIFGRWDNGKYIELEYNIKTEEVTSLSVGPAENVEQQVNQEGNQ